MYLLKEIEDRVWIMNDIGVTALYIANFFGISIRKAIILLDILCAESTNIVNVGVEYFWKD